MCKIFLFTWVGSCKEEGWVRLGRVWKDLGFFFFLARGWAVFLGFWIDGLGKGGFEYLVGCCLFCF